MDSAETNIAKLKELNRVLKEALDQCRKMLSKAQRDNLLNTGQDNDPDLIEREGPSARTQNPPNSN
jgi:hypothetical protein